MSNALTSPAASGNVLRLPLSSTEKNFEIGDWFADAAALGLAGTPFRSVSKRRLHGGKQEGVDLITIDNGALLITVIPTRGMGILKVESSSASLSWNSPVRQVVHPQFVNLESRGGLGWLEGFNEWLVRCGLEFAGGPGRDKFTTNTGTVAEMDLTLHGKIANTPASEVELLIENEPPYRVRLRGRVDERMFYGPKLELWSEISIEPGAQSFRVEDTICNRGATAQEFELIYHINFGAPFLTAGSQFHGAVKRVAPMNEHAAKDVQRYSAYAGPTPGFIEQVYCLWPMADGQGRTNVLLRDRASDSGVALEYSVEQLPYFSLWKNCAPLEEGYVTGLEPGTNFPYNRRVERQAGRLEKIQPAASRSFRLDFSILSRREEVHQVISKIAGIQARQKPQIDADPMRTE